MKSFSLFFLLTIFVVQIGVSQPSFSQRYHLDLNSVVFTGITPTSDSTYLITGILVDTISPFTISSLSLAIDAEGEMLNSNILRATDRFVETWARAVKIDDRIYKLGYNTEIGVNAQGLLVAYDFEGEPLFHIAQPDFRDTAEFFRYNDLIGINDKLYVTGNNSYIGEGDFWWAVVLGIYDREGTVIDGFVYETPGLRTWSRAIKQIDENTLLIGGRLDNYNLTLNNFDVRSKLWAVDTLGSLLWTWESAPDELQQGIQDMALAPDGGIVVATAIGEERVVNASSGILYWEHCIYKLGADLTEEWRTMTRSSFALSNIRFDRIIALADDGGYVAVGNGLQIYPEAEPWVENSADWGGIVAKVGTNGDSLWTRVFVDPTVDTLTEYHALYDVVETPDGGLLLVGESNEPDSTVANQQGWLLKLDEFGCLVPGCHLVSAVEEPVGARFELLLYPNPVREQLSVYLGPGELPAGSSWVIHDERGRQVDRQRARVAAATYLLDTTQLPSGTYTLQLRGPAGEVLAVERFVVVE